MKKFLIQIIFCFLISNALAQKNSLIGDQQKLSGESVGNTCLYNSLQDTIRICDTAYTLDAGDLFTSYSWSNGATTRKINVSQSGFYKVTVTLTGCSATDSTYLILGSTGTITGNEAVCADVNSTKLTLIGTLGKPQWQSSIDNVNYTNITGDSALTYTAMNLTKTTYFRALVPNSVCPSQTTNVKTIQVYTRPLNTFIGNTSRCGPGIVEVSIINDGDAHAWYDTISGGQMLTSLPTSPSTTYREAKFSANISATKTFYVMSYRTYGIGPGSCASLTRTPVVATVNPLSVAGTVFGETSYCTGPNNTVLLVFGYKGNIQWQSSTDNKSFTNIIGATNESYTADNLTTTSYYRAEVVNGQCPAAYSPSAKITIDPLSVAGSIIGNTPVCSGTNNTTLTLNGSTGNIQWQSSTDSLNFTNIVGAVAKTYSPNNLTSTTYYRAIVTSGKCSPITTTGVTVPVNPLPPVPADNTGSRCGTGVLALNALPTSGTVLSWYSTPSGGTVLTGGSGVSTYTTPNIGSTTAYYVESINTTTGCRSATRATVLAKVNPLPQSPNVSAVIACQNVTTAALSATALSGHTLNWYGNNATGGSASAIAPSPATSTLGSIDYYVSQTNNTTGCESSRSKLTVTVNNVPGKANITRDGNGNLVSDVATGNQWYLNGSLIGTATAQSYKPVENGFYTVKITQNGCTGAFSENYYYLITALTELTRSEFKMLAYPNPAKGKIWVNLGERPINAVVLRILNEQGREFYRIITHQQITEINLPEIVSGSYLIEATEGVKRRSVLKFFQTQ